MDTDTTQLVFRKPTKSDPGFLRRAMNAAKAKRAFDGGDPEPLIDFFLDYVTSHERETARAILLELSEDDFDATMGELMEAFEGKANSPAAKSNENLTAASAPTRGRKRTGP